MRNIIDINDDKYNYRNLYFIIVIIGFVMMIVGATYAYVTKSINFDNSSYNTVTTCFNVDYSYSNDGTDNNTGISGILFPSNNPIDGLTGRVSLKIKDECAVEGIGDLKLNVSDVSDVLIKTVTPHCENKYTLETLTDYTEENDCNKSDRVWVTNGSALKYAVYDVDMSEDSDTILPLSVGYIKSKDNILLYDDFEMLKINKEESINYTYYIYIWLDGDISDNSYTSLVFDGYINATVEQVETYSFSSEE